MEEETLRLTAAAKLNLGLDIKLPSEEENLPHLVSPSLFLPWIRLRMEGVEEVTRAQFRGMVKILQAAFQGIENTWTSQSDGTLPSHVSPWRLY